MSRIDYDYEYEYDYEKAAAEPSAVGNRRSLGVRNVAFLGTPGQ